jgi:hypothetical protein
MWKALDCTFIASGREKYDKIKENRYSLDRHSRFNGQRRGTGAAYPRLRTSSLKTGDRFDHQPFTLSE